MVDEAEQIRYHEWAHSPSHFFMPGAVYMVTAGTYHKQLLFNTNRKLDFLLGLLFDEAEHWGWRLQAWAVMANHYHFVAHAPPDALTLRSFTRSLHSKSAVWLNREEGATGRRVWFQYRDTCLTYQRSYLARLNYVHHNPVKHKLVENAETYRWCSMSWFQRRAESGFRQSVLSFKWDGVNVADDF